MSGQAKRRRSRRQRVIAYLTEAFSVGAMGRGTTHGDMSRTGDHLVARAAAQETLRHEPSDDREALLDHVPGWLVLLVAALIVLAAVALPR